MSFLRWSYYTLVIWDPEYRRECWGDAEKVCGSPLSTKLFWNHRKPAFWKSIILQASFSVEVLESPESYFLSYIHIKQGEQKLTCPIVKNLMLILTFSILCYMDLFFPCKCLLRFFGFCFSWERPFEALFLLRESHPIFSLNFLPPQIINGRSLIAWVTIGWL